MATLELTRERGWGDALRAYKLLVDDVVVGDIRAGETKTWEVAPGWRTVRMKIDWCGSPAIDVRAGDQPVRLWCRTNVNPFLALFALFTPSRWIALEQR